LIPLGKKTAGGRRGARARCSEVGARREKLKGLEEEGDFIGVSANGNCGHAGKSGKGAHEKVEAGEADGDNRGRRNTGKKKSISPGVRKKVRAWGISVSVVLMVFAEHIDG